MTGEFKGKVQATAHIHLTCGEDAGAVPGAEETASADFASGPASTGEGRTTADRDVAGVVEDDPAYDIRRHQGVADAVEADQAVGIGDIKVFGGGGEQGGDIEV